MDKTNSAERASPTKMPAENKQPPKTPPKTPPKPPPKPKVPQTDEQKAAVDEKSTTDLKVSIAAPTTADEQQKVSDQQKAILAFKKAIRKPKADISEQKSSEPSTVADRQKKDNELKLKEAESESNSAQKSKKATEQVNVTQTKKTSENNNRKGEDHQPEKVKREEQQQLVMTRDLEQQQKSLDALYAAAREEFDLDLSPTESAVKTLREGREMQKLSVIRNLAELLEAEPVETLQKVMPILQEVLNVEPSNLDMHYEASIVYKNCIKEPKLQRICPQLNDCLLAAILENIELQKENVSAAAWLESLADIAESIPQQLVVSMIVPVAIAQSDSTKRVQRRVISTRLIEKLASLVPREIVQRDLSPCAQILCQDPSTAVRTSIAQRIAVLAQALNSSADCCTLLLPCIIELCKDEEPLVREAVLGSLAVCLPHFSKDAKKTVLLPLLRKCSEQALILRDASLPVIARYLGSWLQSLRDILAPTELRWWLDTYTRILDYAAWQQNSQDEKNQQQQQPTINFTSSGGPTPPKNQIPNEQLRTSCRRMCAFNFPCMVATFGNDPAVFSEKLMPILERFCRDPDDEVRSTVASGFHEILEQRKLAVAGGQQPKTATGEKASATAKASTSSADQIPQLLNPFLELLSSGSSEVVQQLTGNLQRILPVLYSEISASGNRKTNSILSKLNQILVGSDSLLRGTGSWRAHEAYLDSLAVLRNLVRPRELKQTFVPLLRQEVLTARALPCRVAAAKSLLLLMRHLPMAKDRQAIVDFFTQEVGQHPSCYRRRLLLDIVGPLLQHFSREFFIDKFLASILKLSADPISNIRLQLCRTLPAVKKYLLFPKDDQSLSNLERVVRDLLTSEQSPLSRQLIQQSACELSRAETDQKESRANKAKLAEEKKLWTDHDPDEEEEEEKGKKKAPKKQQHRHSSPESGISVAEEVWLPPKQQGGKPGLIKSVTAANVPEIQLQSSSSSNSKTSSKSLDTVAGMAIETSAPPAILGCVIGDSRPPPPQPSAPTTAPSWRNSRQGAPPKLAIVRPQPQVTITQRACSPMPPERKPEAGKTAGAADRGSKLPLSTGRHRPPAPVTNANSQVHQLASKFMGKDGTEPVTDSLKLKKYRPREGITTWAKSPQRLLQQGVSVQQQLNAQAVSRRGSTTSEPSGSAGCGGMSRSASSAPAGGRAGAPLQASASSSSLGGRSSSTSRRPYGLMKVQSTSSAVERKPAQIRCQVISMT